LQDNCDEEESEKASQIQQSYSSHGHICRRRAVQCELCVENCGPPSTLIRPSAHLQVITCSAASLAGLFFVNWAGEW